MGRRGADRFEGHVAALSTGPSHVDRKEPFRRYMTGLLLSLGGESVEPMAARAGLGEWRASVLAPCRGEGPAGRTWRALLGTKGRRASLPRTSRPCTSGRRIGMRIGVSSWPSFGCWSSGRLRPLRRPNTDAPICPATHPWNDWSPCQAALADRAGLRGAKQELGIGH